MPDQTIALVLKAIRESPLPVADTTNSGSDHQPVEPTNADQAFVNRGSIDSLSAQLPEQSKLDALYWTLYGQLLAEAVVPSRITDPRGWYSEYVKRLGSLGMASIVSRQVDVPDLEVDGTIASMFEKVLDGFFEDESQLSRIKKAVNALKNPDNQEALQLINRRTSDDSNSTLLALDALVDRDLNLTIRFAYMAINTRDTSNGGLFWKWQVPGFRAYNEMTLSKGIADISREQLYAAVEAYIPGSIKEINISNN